MSWYILLIIGLLSLGIIVVGVTYLGLNAWRLLKRGMRMSREIVPLADQLGRKAEVLTVNAEHLQTTGDELNAGLMRLQASMARLQVVLQAFSDAMAPYRRVRRYLRGG